MPTSSAIQQARVSRVIGYSLEAGNFSESTANLPQRIAILAEANTANQTGLDSNPVELTSAKAAGDLYGYGSPIHQIMRILRPVVGGGVGAVSTIVYPQIEEVGSVAAEREITVTGTATASVVHNVIINGRSNVDGDSYAISILKDDTPTLIAAKIVAVITGALGCPVTATSALGVVTCPTKWKGLSSEELTITIDTNGVSAGVSYAVASTATGSGLAVITDALTAFGNVWNTMVLNSYNTSAILDQLEAANGTPSATVPSGRYTANLWKPFVAFFGAKDSTVSAVSAITSGRLDEVTNVLCPAPNSAGCSYEAAANVIALLSVVMADTPHLDVSGKSYPDMPTPTTIGEYSSYDNRDLIVKAGASTVDLVNAKYQIQEIVTTYHPIGENPPQYRYVRNLVGIDWNVKFGLDLLEQENVIDHSIADNGATVTVAKVIKPKQWKQILSSYAKNLSTRNLIVEESFMIDSITISTGETNPDRLETFFKYKRSPYARIVSTTGQSGFAFGLTS